MQNLKSGGFLVDMLNPYPNIPNYCGTDFPAWPLDLNECKSFTEEERLSLERREYLSTSKSAMLMKYSEYKKYIIECRAVFPGARSLYCETSALYPEIDNGLHSSFAVKENFLGFDYAFPAGDYYSSILNDLLYRPYLFEHDIYSKLNIYGLFSSDIDLNNFIKARRKKEKEMPYLTFEIGDFIKYALYSVK